MKAFQSGGTATLILKPQHMDVVNLMLPGEESVVLTEQRAGWTPQLVWSVHFGEEINLLFMCSFEPWIAQPLDYTDYIYAMSYGHIMNL
jgi:hypothetical protein